ncbi:peptide deformylase [Clostridiaceae bacterium M8S5]|nr:peptide deformylase [Clostridiaceae bacterium M8S5]
MAYRKLRFEGDPILRRKSREVRKIDKNILKLIDDMIEVMAKEDGLGLAAVQLGILKRVIIIDTKDEIVKLINPVLIHQEGEDIDVEGCLSVPGRQGKVKRPYKVRVRYTDIDGNRKIIKGKGLFARALCHEIDHLNGILYIDKIIEE